jgi:hypothetical protein
MEELKLKKRILSEKERERLTEVIIMKSARLRDETTVK